MIKESRPTRNLEAAIRGGNWDKELKRYPKQDRPRIANMIYHEYLRLGVEKMIDNGDEFIVQPAQHKARRKRKVLILKVGCTQKFDREKTLKLKSNIVLKNAMLFFRGVYYYLRMQPPKEMEYSNILRTLVFTRMYRKRIFKKLKLGKKYYNSYKEEILAQS